MIYKYFFVIDDPIYGGHVKSFLAQLETLNLQDNYLLFLPDNSFINEHIEDYPFIQEKNIVIFNSQGLNKWFWSTDLYKKLKRYLDPNKYNLIHSYSQRCFFSCSIASANLEKTIYISSVMGGPIPFPFYKSADMHIAVSQEQIEKSTYNNNCNYILIPNRIKLGEKKQTLSSYKKILNTKKNVLFISRFDDDKEQPIINAIPILKQLSINYHIKVLGTGNQLEKYKKIIIQEIGEDNIEFLGFVKNPIAYIDTTAIVIGMGRSILEFMLLGTPSILVGFNSTCTLFTLESVEQAFYGNFAGRNRNMNKLKDCSNWRKFEEEKIYDFLYEQYSVELFPNKYTQLILKIKPVKTPKLQVYFEYLNFLFKRIIRRIT